MNTIDRFMRGLHRLVTDERGEVDPTRGQGSGDGGEGGVNAPTLEELRAQRGQAFESMDEIIRTAEEEGTDGVPRPLTEEEQAQYAQHRARYEDLDAQIADGERLERSENVRTGHELARRRARGPLYAVGLAEEPAAAQHSLDELLWASTRSVAAGRFVGDTFLANQHGARNPVEPVMVHTRSSALSPAPAIEDFTQDHQRVVRRFQRTVADMVIFGLLAGPKGEVKSSTQAFRYARTNPRFAERWQSLMRAMDVDTAGEGADWVPTGIGATLHEKVRAAGRVAPLFTRIDLPTNPWKWPLEAGDATAFRVAEPTGDTETKFSASTPGTGAATFDAEIFGSRVLISRTTDPDSAVAVTPYVQGKIAQAFADAEEKAILDGDTDGTHQDSDVGASTTDARTAWDGLRKKALAQTSSDAANVAASQVLVRTARALMGKWGLNPAQLAIVVGVGPYYDLLDEDDFRTVDKFGPQAVVLSGQLGAIDGIPVIVSEHVREDLNASGVHDGVTTNRSYLLVVNRGEFAIGQREGTDVEVDDSLYRETYQRLVIGFQREDFQHIGDAAANADVAILFNIT